ncbi:MAG: Carbonic anhydrase 2 [Fimbriimonadaceae bacterium]|nr:Carbonic anhydrase 2 [Fimbriimonadaceae bacterium]
MDGNQRFATGKNHHRTYSLEDLHEIALVQQPIAAVISCSDSRVVPETIFDQELGSLFVTRVPANVASESARWMIEIAVGDFEVPLVVVLGHSGCLAVRQIVEGQTGSGGGLRYMVQAAFQDVRFSKKESIYESTIEQNAINAARTLTSECASLFDAVRGGRTVVRSGVYDMPSGTVKLLD